MTCHFGVANRRGDIFSVEIHPSALLAITPTCHRFNNGDLVRKIHSITQRSQSGRSIERAGVEVEPSEMLSQLLTNGRLARSSRAIHCHDHRRASISK